MGIFKKSHAVTIEKMDVLKQLVVNENSVRFSLNYSNIDLKPEEVPKLLADIMQIYTLVKPALDKKTLDLENEKSGDPKEEDSKPIDLSDIPF